MPHRPCTFGSRHVGGRYVPYTTQLYPANRTFSALGPHTLPMAMPQPQQRAEAEHPNMDLHNARRPCMHIALSTRPARSHASAVGTAAHSPPFSRAVLALPHLHASQPMAPLALRNFGLARHVPLMSPQPSPQTSSPQAPHKHPIHIVWLAGCCPFLHAARRRLCAAAQMAYP